MLLKVPTDLNYPFNSFYQGTHFLVYPANRALVLLAAMGGNKREKSLYLLGMEPVTAIKPSVRFPDLCHKARKYTVTVPKQMGIGGIMNVALADRAVQPQRFTADHSFCFSILEQRIIDLQPRLMFDAFQGIAKKGKIGYFAHADPRKITQKVALRNPDDRIAKTLQFHTFHDSHTKHLLTGKLRLSTAMSAKPFEIVVKVIKNRRVFIQ